MSTSPFPKHLDYQSIKEQYGEQETIVDSTVPTTLAAEPQQITQAAEQRTGLTGTRLRSYAFAVLTRREYSKKELIEKLLLTAQDRAEVLALVDEFAAANYQSDQRVAEMTLRSQIQRGKGPQRIKQTLKSKDLDQSHIQTEMQQIDWLAQAYQLKVKKYGTAVATEAKLKAKQIRFLLYRGFDMDVVMKAVCLKSQDWEE